MLMNNSRKEETESAQGEQGSTGGMEGIVGVGELGEANGGFGGEGGQAVSEDCDKMEDDGCYGAGCEGGGWQDLEVGEHDDGGQVWQEFMELISKTFGEEVAGGSIVGWSDDASFNDMSDLEPRGAGVKDEQEFSVMSQGRVVVFMLQVVENVSTIFQLPMTTTRVLLNYSGWDGEKLLDDYFEDSDAKKQMLEVTGLDIAFEIQKGYGMPSSSMNFEGDTLECGICYDTKSVTEMFGGICGHPFCMECWQQHVSNFLNGVSGQAVTCPEFGCKVLANDALVLSIIKDGNLYAKYERLITNSFIQFNRYMKWCPAPDCNNAIAIQFLKAGKVSKSVKCLCGHQFCFRCEENCHDPMDCRMNRLWNDKCREMDMKEQDLVYVEPKKECPNCGVLIEKTGGCNTMTCKCGTVFCWICMHQHRRINEGRHDYAECHREEMRMREEERQRLLKLQQESDPEFFNFQRHRDEVQKYLGIPLDVRRELGNFVYRQMCKEKLNYESQVNVTFIQRALDVLTDCYETLGNSAAFQYFWQENPPNFMAQNIFSFLKQDLQDAAEQLRSLIVGTVLIAEDYRVFKTQVEEVAYKCGVHLRKLLEHVQESFENGLWFFKM